MFTKTLEIPMNKGIALFREFVHFFSVFIVNEQVFFVNMEGVPKESMLLQRRGVPTKGACQGIPLRFILFCQVITFHVVIDPKN